MSLTLKAYQSRVDHWVRTFGVRYFNEMTNLAILTEEVGEVARAMVRTYGEQSFKSEAHARDASLADELADVLFVVACIANQTGIDLGEAMEKNLEKKSRRDCRRHWQNPKLTCPR
jgi:NTP pyrophosphatase (non-canonical NTP hydrolase)